MGVCNELKARYAEETAKLELLAIDEVPSGGDASLFEYSLVCLL